MKAALKVLTFKPEATYGVDPVPTTVANVLLAQNVDINPLEMETDAYEPVSNRFGEDEKIVGATWCSVSFDVLLGGGGTPIGDLTKAPNHDPVLRAAAMARTLTAGVSIVYTPVDTGEESGAMYYHVDGVLQKMLGLRGDITLSFTSMKAPVLSFKGIGLNVPMIDTVLPTPTLPTVPRPVAVNRANTTITVHGYSARVSELSITLGNDYQYRNLIGREDVVVVGRKSTGKITLELPLVAEKDFLGAAGVCTLASTGVVNLLHGTAVGNRLAVGLAAVQLFKPKPKVDKGILMLECELHLVRNQITLLYN